MAPTGEIPVDCKQRNEIWQERVRLRVEKIEEENCKDQGFHPKVNKVKKCRNGDKGLDGRFSAFFSKLDEIIEKIENSLVGPVL